MKWVRSILSVPGDRPDFFQKSRRAGADLVHFDLEDSVLPSQRSYAREQVLEGAQYWEFNTWSVRVNRFGSEDYHRDVEAFQGFCPVFFLPKVESHLEILYAAEALGGDIVAILETAKGLQRCDDILQGCPNLAGVVFGESDFCADMRLPYQRCEWARQKIVLAARANRVPIFASPWPYRGIPMETAENEGFDGQICLNPEQVTRVNQVYSPTTAQVWMAQRIVAQHAEGKRNFYVIPAGGPGRDLLLASEFIHWARRCLEASSRASGDGGRPGDYRETLEGISGDSSDIVSTDREDTP